MLHAERSSVFLYDSAKRELWSAFTAQGQEITLKVDGHRAGLAAVVARKGVPVLVEDAYDHLDFNDTFDKQSKFTTKSVLAIPLRRKTGEVLGVLQCINKKSQTNDGFCKTIAFTHHDQVLLERIGEVASLAMENILEATARAEEEDRQQQLMFEISRALAQESELPELAQRVTQNTQLLLRAERASLFLYDEDSRELCSVFADNSDAIRISVDMDHAGIAAYVVKNPSTIRLDNAYTHMHFNDSFDLANNFVTRAMIVCPLIGRSKMALGVLQVINKEIVINKRLLGERVMEPAFTVRDQTIMESVAQVAALAVENILGATGEERAKKLMLQSLVQIQEALGRISDLGLLSQAIMTNAQKFLRAERSTLYLFEADARKLHSAWVAGANSKEQGNFEFYIDGDRAGIAARVAREGKSACVEDAHDDPDFNPTFDRKNNFVTRSVLAVPLITQSGHTLGVLQVVNKKPPISQEEEGTHADSHTTFTHKDMEWLQRIGEVSVLAFENKQLSQKNDHLSSINHVAIHNWYESLQEQDRLKKEAEAANKRAESALI